MGGGWDSLPQAPASELVCAPCSTNCRAWGYGAAAARLTPDQKVGSSNLSGLRGVRSRQSCLGRWAVDGTRILQTPTVQPAGALRLARCQAWGLWCIGNASDSRSERWGVQIPLASDMLNIQSCLGRRVADRTPVLQTPEAWPAGALCLARLRAWGDGATSTRLTP